ncbi:MAG: hypothetical protein QME71_04235 [Dehalococcoidia bacterium]|nr:hypothetical protein [Dehalococcoidia bacterium]
MAEKVFECELTEDEEIVLRIRKPGMRMFSPEVRGHLLSARKEMLMAMRNLIDAALAGLTEKEEKEQKARRTEIRVE